MRLPDTVTAMRAGDLDLGGADLVCLAVPARDLPAALAAHGEAIPPRAGVLVLSKGLVPPLGTLPSAFAGERTRARAVACLGGPGHAADALQHGACLVAASTDAGFARQVADVLNQAGLDVQSTTDVTGVELAGAAKNAAALAAAAASVAGPNAAGAAAGKVFAEVDAYARRHGGRAETFAGLAGAGDLVATVVAQHSRNRRAGELLGRGMPAARSSRTLGQTAESLDALPLLAATLQADGVAAPVVDGLAAVVEGRLEAEAWAADVTAPAHAKHRVRAA